MKEFLPAFAGVAFAILLLLGFVGLLVSIVYYTPTSSTEYYKGSKTVCRAEKGWGFTETKKYCLQGVEIPESNTQNINIQLN